MKKNKLCWFTSFNKKYYEYIGRISLPTWRNLNDDKFFLYEGNPDEIPSYAEKIDIHCYLKEFHPLMQKNIESKSKKAFKFFKKAFSIWYGLKTFSNNYDYVIWLDTDAIIQKPINLTDLLPQEDELFSTIIRGIHGCDSGFVAFNTNHANFTNFLEEYISYYTKEKIWHLHKPWDAYILEDFSKTEKIKNLYTGNQDNASCGFQNTLVCEYITHYWGRKGKINLGNINNDV